MRNELTFNGTNFNTFSAYIATSNFMDGASKDMESVKVLGRSGELLINNNRYNNITLKVLVYVTQNMKTNMDAMRHYLESCHGYFVYEESLLPNEYRMASFITSFAPDVYDKQGGTVQLEFTCLPQRFLKVGDTPITADGESSSYTGNPVSIDNPSGLDKVSALSVDINPVQDLHGYDSPWVGGAGKNKLPLTLDNLKTINTSGSWSDNVWTRNGCTLTVNEDEAGNVTSITANGTATADVTLYLVRGITSEMFPEPMTLTGCPSGGGASTYRQRVQLQASPYTALGNDNGSGVTVSIPAEAHQIVIRLASGTVANNLVFEPMFRLATETDATYEPYSNICPITGWSSANVVRTVDGDSTTYPISFSQAGTVYGGTVDVVSGELTVTHVKEVYDGSEHWVFNNAFYHSLSNHYVKAVNEINFFCDSLTPVPQASNLANMATKQDLAISMYGGGSDLWRVLINNKSLSTAEELQTWLASNPVTFVYPLATPITYQLTPTEVSLLTGTNIISADCGDVGVTVTEPSVLENPTLFESKPLIRVYGNGTLNINAFYITVANNPYEYIDIDCELMDCRYGLNNANAYVSFSTTDFITLQSGNNYVAPSGFAKVEITPRWFEI